MQFSKYKLAILSAIRGASTWSSKLMNEHLMFLVLDRVFSQNGNRDYVDLYIIQIYGFNNHTCEYYDQPMRRLPTNLALKFYHVKVQNDRRCCKTVSFFTDLWCVWNYSEIIWYTRCLSAHKIKSPLSYLIYFSNVANIPVGDCVNEPMLTWPQTPFPSHVLLVAWKKLSNR